MNRINRSIKALRSIRHDSVVTAMLAAIPSADDDAKDAIVDEFLKRSSRDAVRGLIHHFEHFTPSGRRAIIGQIERIAPDLKDALSDRRSRVRLQAIQMVLTAHVWPLLPAVGRCTGDGDPQVSEAAVECLLHWPYPDTPDDFTDDPSAEVAGTETRQQSEAAALRTAIIESMRHFDCHQSEPLVQRLYENDICTDPRLRAILSDAEGDLVATLRNQIALAKAPAVRKSILKWLATPGLTPPTIHAIGCAARDGWFSQLLENGHLLCDGRIERSLSRVPQASQLMPTLPQQAAMGPASLGHLPRWIRTIPLSANDRANALAQIARSDDAAARLFALRQLIEMTAARSTPDEATDGLIAAFCHDKDIRVARVAVRQLIATNAPNLSRTLLRLINSEHEEIREIAGQRVAPWGFVWFWNAWPSLNHPQRASAASALMKIDPRFHRQLGDRMLSRRPDERIKALTIVADLNQGPLYENILIGVARSTRTKEVASAVRGLVSVRSDLATHVLEASLAHSDNRVRANAVEALGRQRARDRVPQLESMASREANRPRANAIAELFKLDRPVAYDALRDMLGDREPPHRISGLWLADHMGIVGAAPRIAEVSVSDQDAAVRTRAQRTFDQLINAMNKPITTIGGAVEERASEKPVPTFV